MAPLPWAAAAAAPLCRSSYRACRRDAISLLRCCPLPPPTRPCVSPSARAPLSGVVHSQDSSSSPSSFATTLFVSLRCRCGRERQRGEEGSEHGHWISTCKGDQQHGPSWLDVKGWSNPLRWSYFKSQPSIYVIYVKLTDIKWCRMENVLCSCGILWPCFLIG